MVCVRNSRPRSYNLSLNKILLTAALILVLAASGGAQTCPDVRTVPDRHAAALQLAACLGNPDPKVRDTLAFEALAAAMRSNLLESRTLSQLRHDLLAQLTTPNGSALLVSFSALTLAEVARTDRLKPWMTDGERQELIDAATAFLGGVTDYRAFSDELGFVHAVAHGADFALQLALNPAITKPQLDRLLPAIALQIAPRDPSVAYWAAEPDRLSRVVLFIAQRKLHSDAEWKAWFATVMDPKPLTGWDVAFNSEAGIRRRHNVRAFLLSVYATAMTSDDAGVKQLVVPTRESLKLVP